MELARASRQQIAPCSIWGSHERLEERNPCQCRPGRFGTVLHLRHHLTFETSIFAGYGWEHLPEGSLVVDVGGGVGSQSLTLASNHPQLRFVVQDRESVVGDAINVCVMNRTSPTRIWRVLTNVLAIVLEEEHALCARIRPGENPRFIGFICSGVGTRLTF